MSMAAVGGGLRRAAARNHRAGARHRAERSTVSDRGWLWWSASVAAGGACRPWVGCFERHGGAGWLWILAQRFGYHLRYGVEVLEVTLLLGRGCRTRLCQGIGPDHVPPWTSSRSTVASCSRPRSNGGFDDAGAQAPHLGGQMLLFERLEDGPRPAGFEPGQARR